MSTEGVDDVPNEQPEAVRAHGTSEEKEEQAGRSTSQDRDRKKRSRSRDRKKRSRRQTAARIRSRFLAQFLKPDLLSVCIQAVLYAAVTASEAGAATDVILAAAAYALCQQSPLVHFRTQQSDFVPFHPRYLTSPGAMHSEAVS